jgi:hypothetical protein
MLKASPVDSLDAATKLVWQLRTACDALTMEVGEQDRCLKLRQRMVFRHMARMLYVSVMAHGNGDHKERLIAMEGLLSLSCLPTELHMSGVAAMASTVIPIILAKGP